MEDHSWEKEHGNFTGISAMQDLHLMSYVNFAFVGTLGSSFSELSAAIAIKPGVAIHMINMRV